MTILRQPLLSGQSLMTYCVAILSNHSTGASFSLYLAALLRVCALECVLSDRKGKDAVVEKYAAMKD